MLFPSNIFILNFLPILLIAYFWARNKKIQIKNIILLVASLIFYAWGEPLFIILLLFSVFINWGAAILIDTSKPALRKGLLIANIAYNIIILFIFKYLAFSLTGVNTLFGANIIIPRIALPLGISFFTFQAMSYVIDVYRKESPVQKNYFNVALYILFFPQLVAGPIVRYSTIDKEIRSRKESREDFYNGICRFVIGLGKKVIFANALAVIADDAFSAGATLSCPMAWLGAIAYTLQIYYDFSGYSDMAIGLGLLFGFHFSENFNYPYISRSVSEFWRRWHISLSTWFRDYVYIPLGGNRVSKYRNIFNLFIVWTLTGIWHGANLTFIVWGLYYFALLLVEKLSGFAKKKHGFLTCIYVMVFVIIGWVIFRADSLGAGVAYLGAMIGQGDALSADSRAAFELSENIFILIPAILFCTPIVPAAKEKLSSVKGYGIVYTTVIVLLFIACMSFIVKGSYNPFIYFNF